ncbi:YqcI/YcgG family protein [Litoribacterium kuwaitense]|uniref:YqcI/YcgG family protein n=1 Tax=Litoribacterium kuwaitense TaxID=1398745 RepID=UPI001FE74276|nr:YqcI/YcgG family protein [Litoribacterium kuwaitense]
MEKKLIYSRHQLDDATTCKGWEQYVYQQFYSGMLESHPPFPCVLGVDGVTRDQVRYCFIHSAEEDDVVDLANALRTYVENCREFGRNTSLVAFFKPEPQTYTLSSYEDRFWTILQLLNDNDEKPWPPHIPKHPDHPLWEFCFHGEPMFVVCNTPAHEERLSRHSDVFMMTFQPRWVFEGLGLNTKAGQVIQHKVRKRLNDYDKVAAHPELGWYGQEENREWRQYFLHDAPEAGAAVCPFRAKEGERRMEKAVRIQKHQGEHLETVVKELLPTHQTGCLEIQYDMAGQAHPDHTHPEDEILHILEGSLTFQAGEDKVNCQRGDRIFCQKTSGTGRLLDQRVVRM